MMLVSMLRWSSPPSRAPLCTSLLSISNICQCVVRVDRGFRNRSRAPILMEMSRRKERIRRDQIIREGREAVIRRASFQDWYYLLAPNSLDQAHIGQCSKHNELDLSLSSLLARNFASELAALSSRLSESFDEHLLREALLDESFDMHEKERLVSEQGVHLDAGQLEMSTNNDRLATQVGYPLMVSTLSAFIRASFSRLPEEGVVAFCNHLMSEAVLSDIAFHLGIKDLILAKHYPPSRSSYARSLCAIVGAMYESEGNSRGRVARFVIEVIGAHLHVQDVNHLWNIEDPVNALTTIMHNDNRGLPEARLLWAAGPHTMMACFHVGFYSDKHLIGQCAGENLEEAETLAALDALHRLFHTHDSRRPLPMHDALLRLRPRNEPHVSLANWSTQWADNNEARGTLANHHTELNIRRSGNEQ